VNGYIARFFYLFLLLKSNSARVGFYNKLLSLVENQRNNPGCPFERNLFTALILRPRTGRESDAEDQQPKARNHVSELMEFRIGRII
jgi:hypothetical protein